MASINKLARFSGVVSRSALIPPHFEISVPLRSLFISAQLLGPKAKPAAAASVAKATTKLERKNIPVETDPEKLAKYCCINYMADKTERGPGPEIREDEFYPDWLWELNKEVVPHYKMDPQTPEYWNKRQRAYGYFSARLREKKPYGIM